jgi:hypothetical protein
MLYMYMNMEEVQPYFKKFDKIYWTSREQHTLNKLNYMDEHELKGLCFFNVSTCSVALKS